MNAIEILRFINQDHDTEMARLLWFLHAIEIEQGDFETLSAEMHDLYGDEMERFESAGFYLLDGLRQLCQPGYAVEYGERFLGKFGNFLFKFKKRKDDQEAECFYRTNIGREVCDVLDWCLEERRPCFIQGLEGRGKTAATQAWARANRDRCRYVSLPGILTEHDFFVALARPFGLVGSTQKFSQSLKFRVADVAARSGLVILIDEAHFALPAATSSRPPRLLDWIDTALVNKDVPVVLITTPQFGKRLAQFQEREIWNAKQFIRRFSGKWKHLPTATDEKDLVELINRFAPEVGSKGLKLAIGFAGAFGRDVSGLFDLIRDAARRARKAGSRSITYQHLKDAYDLDRVAIENAIAESVPSAPIDDTGNDPVEVAMPEREAAAVMPTRSSKPAATEFTPPARSNRPAELVEAI